MQEERRALEEKHARDLKEQILLKQTEETKKTDDGAGEIDVVQGEGDVVEEGGQVCDADHAPAQSEEGKNGGIHEVVSVKKNDGEMMASSTAALEALKEELEHHKTATTTLESQLQLNKQEAEAQMGRLQASLTMQEENAVKERERLAKDHGQKNGRAADQDIGAAHEVSGGDRVEESAQ